MASLSLDDRREFNACVRAAKGHESRAGIEEDSTEAAAAYRDALAAYEAAGAIDPENPKLSKKIAKMTRFVASLVHSPSLPVPPAAPSTVAGAENATLPKAQPTPVPMVPFREALSPVRPVTSGPPRVKSPVVQAVPATPAWQPVAPSVARSPDLTGAGIKQELAESSPHGWVYNSISDVFVLPGGLAVPAATFLKLYPHQREGVAWMWGLHPEAAGDPVFSVFGVDLMGDARATLSRAAAASGDGSQADMCWSPGEGSQEGGDMMPSPEEVRDRGGGILGDDMGLGKTVQVSAFLGALLQGGHARCVLVVAPSSILPTWQDELETWAPGLRVAAYAGSQAERTRALRTVQEEGGVLLSTYGMITHNATALRHIVPPKRRRKRASKPVSTAWGRALAGMRGGAVDVPGRVEEEPVLVPHTWCGVICDEGHKIKNSSTKIAKALRSLPAAYRLLLTGTPLQNRLDELWALFDYATAGSLLGDRRAFNTRFANAIVAARERGASHAVQMRGDSVTGLLRVRIAPHFLRREKGVGGRPKSAGSSPSPATLTPGLTSTKTEVVVWTGLTPLQETLYSSFLHSADVKRVLNESGSPLAALSILKKVCNSPLLLAERERGRILTALRGSVDEYSDTSPEAAAALVQALVEGGTPAAEEEGFPPELVEPAVELARLSTRRDTAALVACSAKLQFLGALLPVLRQEGARTLVFSGSKVMLTVAGAMLAQAGLRFVRIDGDVSDPGERRRIVDTFNADASLSVCLLTTGVGALGLTLTGASRVVILDPHWNPSVDAQAVDRAYRIGQTREVITYRLITCGTVEEKQYRLQVFKGGVAQSVLGHGSGHATGGSRSGDSGYKRYLTRAELRAMFTLGNTHTSETADLLAQAAGKPPPPAPDSETEAHLAVLQGGHFSDCIVGVSRHDHLYRLGAEAAKAVDKRLRTAMTPARTPRTTKPSTPDDGAGQWGGSQEQPDFSSPQDTDTFSSPQGGVSPSSLLSPPQALVPAEAVLSPGLQHMGHQAYSWEEDDFQGYPAVDSPPHPAVDSPPHPAVDSPPHHAVDSPPHHAVDSPADGGTPASDSREAEALTVALAAAEAADAIVESGRSDARVQDLAQAWADVLTDGTCSLNSAKHSAEVYLTAAQELVAAGGSHGDALPLAQRYEAVKAGMVYFVTSAL